MLTKDGLVVVSPRRRKSLVIRTDKDYISVEQQWMESNENRPLHTNAYSARFYQQAIHLANKRLQLSRQRPTHPRWAVDAAKVAVLDVQHRWLSRREHAIQVLPPYAAKTPSTSVSLPVLTRPVNR